MKGVLYSIRLVLSLVGIDLRLWVLHFTVKGQAPRGVRNVEYYYSSRGNCCIIGVSHNKVAPSELRDFLDSSIDINPSAVCVEAPNSAVQSTEHKGAKMYCDDDTDGARLLAIDTKSVSVDDGEYMSKIREEASDLSVPKYNESRAKGEMESSNPEFAEFCKERDQMMVTEIFGVMESGYRNVVAIVGSFHASGIKNQMGIFEEKYDY